MSAPSFNFKNPIILAPSREEALVLDKTQNLYHCGMGKLRAAAACERLVQRHGADFVLLTGFCGGLENCEVGDVVQACKIIEGDFDARPLEGYPHFVVSQPYNLAPPFRSYQLATFFCQDRFLTSNPYVAMTEHEIVSVTDMESYAVATTCKALNVPYAVVKIVSDMADGHAPEDFSKALLSLGKQLLKVVEDAQLRLAHGVEHGLIG